MRGIQTLAAFGERTRLKKRARIPTDHAFFELLNLPGGGLLDHFREREAPLLSPAFADRESTAAELRHRFGATTGAALTDRADRIASGRFDLLGLRGLSFDSPIDWHLDPLSGQRTPLVHWSRIRARGDLKVVWELNRHQHFVVLGRAYWLTGDERYATAFAEQLNSWIEENPPGLGINWSSSLEVALRAIAWTWALELFRDSESLTPALFTRALKLLHLHGRHVRRYLSTYSSPNTHLTGEALGLFYLGTFWPEFRAAPGWRSAGLRILQSSLDRQVEGDGVYFERSTAYHRYTFDFCAHLVVLSAANGEQLGSVRDCLEALLEHLLFIVRPDGTMPLIGDDDGGRLLPLDERDHNDLRPTLALGAGLLLRPDSKAVGGEASEEMLWLLGKERLAAFDQLEPSLPANTSRAFPDGGVYVMRDDWSDAGNVLTVDCGPHGALGGGHAHADALAFDLSADGRPLLVDAGTFSYVRGGGHGDYFRSTAAHNTVVVDKVSSSEPRGPFSWSRVARSSLRSWHSDERCDFFEGMHDGYRRLDDPVTHIRTILFFKRRLNGVAPLGAPYWIIRDRLVAAGAHWHQLGFHFAAGTEISLDRVDEIPIIREAGLQITTFGAAGDWQLRTEHVSPCYGLREPAPVAEFTTLGRATQDLVTFMFPRTTTTVRELEAEQGRAFEILEEGSRELFLLGDDAGVEVAGLVAEEATGYALARNIDDRWLVEPLGPLCAV